MYWSMDEEFKSHWIGVGIEEGMAKGREDTKREDHAILASSYVDTVHKMVSKASPWRRPFLS